MESLTRQAHPERIVQGGDATSPEDAVQAENFASSPRKNRNLRALAFPLVVADTLLFVWLIGSFTRAYDVSLLNPLLGRLGVQSIFTNPPLVGIISVIVLLVVLWIRRK